MTTADDHRPQLEWTGERYIPEISGNIRLEHLHRYLLARDLCSGRRVLDIACGEGYGSDLLAGVAAFTVGVDIATEVVRHARGRYGRPHLSFAAGDCAAIPLADGSVDVVVSFETLEHHDRHDEMLREIKRVLGPNGLVIISSPDRVEYSDVPGYENPYHAHELDRSEFARLMSSHFKHVALLGQRIKAGSIVGPVDETTSTSFATFDVTDPAARTGGLRAPLYLIALATDGALPPAPTGLLDGGAFLWPTPPLEGSKAVDPDTPIEVLHEEIDRLAAYVEAAQSARREADARTAVYEQEVLRRGQRIEEVQNEKAALEDLNNRAHAALDAEREQVQSLGAALDAERRLVQSLTSARDDLQKRLVDRQQQDRTLAAAADEARQNARPSLSRKTISDTTRAIYRRLPLSPGLKQRLKAAVFTSMPGLVRHTVAYRHWDQQRRGLTPAAAAHAPQPVRVEQEAVPPPTRGFDHLPIAYTPLTTKPGIDTRMKAIAFYLPQFHPIPENDEWWGKGFTEWHNVARGRPQFPGHYQPHLPGELGFYDLRNVEIQRRQIELAKAYGLFGFCYHHYWFGGTRLLRRPLDQLLANSDLDFPFCLCWANENWTRRWDGLDAEVLISQQHSPEDDLAFIRDIEPALRDSRYIRVDGRPLLVVYRPSLLPDANATVARWRYYCREIGLPDLFLVSAQAFDRTHPGELGFDAALEFAPNNMGAPKITSEVAGVDPNFAGAIYDYSYLVESSRHYEPPNHLLFRSVTPMWDNEARRPGRGAVFAGSTPALYGEWLENACRYTLDRVGTDKPFVFINAWNEWAEGAHLEPDRDHGYAYLQATADALQKFPSQRERPSIVVVSHDAYFHGAQHVALHLTKTLSQSLGYDVDVLLCGPGPLTADFAAAGTVHDFSPSAAPDYKARVVRELYAGGARLALCNTSVVGDTVALLKAAGFRVVSMVHELPGVIGQYGLDASIATIARDADRVVFPAAIVRDRFTELTHLPPEKAIIRPQGLLRHNRFDGRTTEARHELRSLLGLPPETRVALSVGFADRRKGIDLFVDVGLDVIARRADTVFVWVGHHDADAFDAARARVAAAGAAGRFVFPGLVADPAAFFAGADVYLMTSREDPFPLVVLDALDASLPTIGFEGAGGFVELLQRGCGVLVPYLDTRAMADAVLRLLGDPAEAERLTRLGHEIVRREFSFVEYTRDLVRFAEGPRPQISVVVPNYNYAHYLPGRLRSILTQTLRPTEIIVLDDCSSDDSVATAERILSNAGVPYRIIRNEANQGVYRQWLRGLREATCELVWIAEADDDCSSTFLETLAPLLAAPDVVLSYCQSKQIDENGRELAPDYLAWTADVSATKWQQGYVRRGIDEIRDSLIVKNTIPNVSAVLMRKPDLAQIEPQLATLRNAGDWLTYVHVLERGSIAFVPQALNRHRRHTRSVTLGHGGLNLMREILQVQRFILGRHAISTEVEEKRERHLQETYEYLGLNADGAPPYYKDHEALSGLAAAAR